MEGVLVHTRCEGYQAFEEGAHHEPNASGGLLPILRRSGESCRKGCRIKQITHAALSSRCVRPSLSQNGVGVSGNLMAWDEPHTAILPIP